MGNVSADFRVAGRWIILLIVAAAVTIVAELIGEGIRMAQAAWDTIADQGLERRPKALSVAATIRLTLFVGIMEAAVLFTTALALAAEPAFSFGLLRRAIVPLATLLLLPEALGRWLAWSHRPQGKASALLGCFLIIAGATALVWVLAL